MADCNDSDRPGEADETMIAVAAAVGQRPVRAEVGAAAAAGCTSPEPSVAAVGGICARYCPDRCQGQQNEASRTIPAAAAAGVDCDSDGGVVCCCCCVVTSWKRSVMRSKRTIAASSCSRDRSIGPRCCS